MTTVLLVRHGRTAANSGGVLAGWTPGVGLDETGREQVSALARRLSPVPVSAVVTSPLQRCEETTAALVAERSGLAVHRDDRLGEVRYGDWTGGELKKLAKDPLWRVVQSHPSAVTFPGDGGEAMAAMQQRAVGAVREWNATLGDDAIYLVVSHGDVIKAILADALGLHLDQFQRIMVGPASLSVVQYTELRPFVERMNDSGAPVDGLVPKPRRGRRRSANGTTSSKTRRGAGSDAVVGGGT
jgi:probable phosphomutase (TIGR03848 family)